MLFKIFAASFVSGVSGAMGFGSGIILIIWLTTFMDYGQLEAQGINLLFFICCAGLSLLIFSKKGTVNKAEAVPIAAGGAVGVTIGQFLLPVIPSEYLSKLFGIFIILLSIKQFFNSKKRD